MARIVLDAMGGDDAPRVPVEGALAALSRNGGGVEIVLVGEPDAVRSALRDSAPDGPPPNLRVVSAPRTIEPDEPPVMAVRRKKDSSIVVGVGMLGRGEADAFVSAGPTGAVMAASHLELGPLPGVDRPAIGAVFPTVASPTLVLDVGGNLDCRPEHLRQFAHLGLIYARDMLGRPEPRVGLLNVGEESKKGDETVVVAHALLEGDPELNFVGNVEGNQIIRSACDVLVCDGFVGNVLLKFFESMAGFVVGWLEERGEEGLVEDGELSELLSVLDYAEYGGAPLLGVNGVSIVCHGGSSPRAIENALHFAARSVRSKMVEHLTREMARARDPETEPLAGG